jgi:hypothetical protein
VVQRTNLGSVRMWQEELAEIARLVGELPGVKVRIEAADEFELTDVEADLPGLGERVSNFSVTALRPADGDQSEVVSVKLTKHGSYIEAADPDLDTLGVIRSVEVIAKSCRRLPAKLEPYFDLSPTVSAPGTTAPGTPGALLPLVAAILAGIFGVACAVGAGQHLMHALGPLTRTVTLVCGW